MACTPPEELVGYGAVLEYKNPLTDAWVTVAGTRDLSLPNRTRGALETTSGATGRWRQRRPGVMKEQAPVSYAMWFRKSQWYVLNAMLNNDTVYEWRVVLMEDPQQFYYAFCGFVTDIGDEIPMEELIESTVEITPTGAPSWGNLL
jgi:predicted secreted protein